MRKENFFSAGCVILACNFILVISTFQKQKTICGIKMYVVSIVPVYIGEKVFPKNFVEAISVIKNTVGEIQRVYFQKYKSKRECKNCIFAQTKHTDISNQSYDIFLK